MEYLTVRQTAEKWKVSERLVQKYCSGGRIEGAIKFGSSWGIPADVDRPKDPRKKGKGLTTKARICKEIPQTKIMPLMNASFKPGHCIEYIESMESGPRKDVAWAEYYYFSGNPERAVRQVEMYLRDPDMELRLSACLIYTYASLSVGEISSARHTLEEMKNCLMAPDACSEVNAAKAFVAAASAILLHLPVPEDIPPVTDYLTMLPPGLQAFAMYVQAHYVYLQGDYSRSLGIVETTLALQMTLFPIPAIYLHLVAVMDHMGLRQTEQAHRHLLQAWELARQDDLLEGFGEHHGLLGGTLEAVIKRKWPEEFKRIIAITYRFSEGWRKIHNPDTGHDVADNLTTTEFTIAMLAARGWTNQEIGEHMNISPNTVKRHISITLQKLHVKQRQDLNKYMLL